MMKLLVLHRCKTCAKLWFPRKPETLDICPTCDATFAEADKLLLKIRENLLTGREFLQVIAAVTGREEPDKKLPVLPDPACRDVVPQ